MANLAVKPVLIDIESRLTVGVTQSYEVDSQISLNDLTNNGWYTKRERQRTTSLEKSLLIAAADMRGVFSRYSNHLSFKMKLKMFIQIDAILSHDSWDISDSPPSLSSFENSLKILAVWKPDRCPGISFDSLGNISFSWRKSADDRFFIEFPDMANVRWVHSRVLFGQPAIKSGQSSILALPDELPKQAVNFWIDI